MMNASDHHHIGPIVGYHVKAVLPRTKDLNSFVLWDIVGALGPTNTNDNEFESFVANGIASKIWYPTVNKDGGRGHGPPKIFKTPFFFFKF